MRRDVAVFVVLLAVAGALLSRPEPVANAVGAVGAGAGIIAAVFYVIFLRMKGRKKG